MIKYRIIEINTAGDTYYKIMEKVLFWWFDVRERDDDGKCPKKFTSVQKAKEFIEKINAKGKIVEEITI